MRHHEVIIDFSRRGIAALLKRAIARSNVQPAIAQDRLPVNSGL